MACCCGPQVPCGCTNIRETLTVTIGPNTGFFRSCAPAGYDIQGTYILNRVADLTWYYEEPGTLACAPSILKFVQLTVTCDGKAAFGARQYLPDGWPPPSILNPGSECCVQTGGTFGCYYNLFDSLPQTPFPGVSNWMCAEYSMTTSAQINPNGQQVFARFGSGACSGSWYTIGP